jgi:hypothetical protein
MSIGALLAPAAVLVVWTLIMLGWTAATRFPSMARAGLDVKTAKRGGRGQDLEAILPPEVVWKAHNHTHLHEQPTLFYAVIGILALLGAVTTLNVALAWAYVGLRIAHSIYQATVNIVRIRFLIFITATAVLVVLAVNALLAALAG